MTDQPAGVTHEAVLDVHKRRLGGRLALAGEVVFNAIVGDPTVLPGDVVVRSRTDGTVALRVDVGFGEAPDVLLAAVRADLEQLTLAELAAKWDPPDPVD